MKKTSVATPISMTAALACIISLGLSCSKKNKPEGDSNGIISPTNIVVDATATNAADAGTNADVTTPAPGAAAEAVITNPPLATTTPVAPPAAPEPAPTAPSQTETNHTIIEMPATVPTAPTNFYSGDFTNKSSCCSMETCGDKNQSDFSLLFRAGYQHVNHGDNHDTYWVSVKFGYNAEDLRERVGKNGWLIPDAYAELSHQYLPKPDDSKRPGSGEGLRFNADFYWPWVHWTSRMFVRTNGTDETYLPLRFGFGPTANVGLDEIFDDSHARFARYVGVRATMNHGFLEYTAGATEGFNGTRSQVVTEVPFYVSHKNNVRYYFRGEWNTGFNKYPDDLEAGLFVELPFETLVSPSKWGSLIPGVK